MSKAKAITLAVGCCTVALICGITQQSNMSTFLPCVLMFLAWGVLFAAIGGYKTYRDHAIITRAREEAARVERRIEPPAMTTPGSSRLFIPPQLDR